MLHKLTDVRLIKFSSTANTQLTHVSEISEEVSVVMSLNEQFNRMREESRMWLIGSSKVLMGITYICIRCVDNNHDMEECVDLVELMDFYPIASYSCWRNDEGMFLSKLLAFMNYFYRNFPIIFIVPYLFNLTITND